MIKKKLKILPKTFLYTLGIVTLVLLFAHSLIYFSLPSIYLTQKNKEAHERLASLQKKLEQQSTDKMLAYAESYARNTNTNIFLKIGNEEYRYNGFSNVDIYTNEEYFNDQILQVIKPDSQENESILLASSQFTGKNKQQVTLQMTLNVQPVNEVKRLIFTLLPFTFLISLVLSAVAAYLYSRKITNPIKEILRTTKEMESLTPDAYNVVISEDEIGLLAETINDLYETLLTTIHSLEEQIEKIKNLENEKIEFLRSASHELKTPLMSLSVLLENMLYDVGKYQDHHVYLKKAYDITNETSLMVKDILTSSQFQLSNGESCQWVNLEEVFNEILNNYLILIRQKNLVLHYSSIQNPSYLWVTKSDIEKVFSNLLLNAIEYTSEGNQIYIRISEKKVVIKNQSQEISADTLQKLFEPFYRGSLNRSPKNNGSGLGLYIVKTILEYHQVDYNLLWKDGYFIFSFSY